MARSSLSYSTAPSSPAGNDEEFLNRRLYTRLRSQILTGYFRPGTKLPSTRALSASVGVSRNTVVHAFEQLAAEGYLSARSGSGSYVAANLPDNLIQSKTTMIVPHGQRNDRRFDHQINASADDSPLRFARIQELRPFTIKIPALDAFPYTVWARLQERQWKKRRADVLRYADPAGYLPLRKAIHSYLTTSRGVQCQPEQIVVVAGAQQALRLVSQVLIRPGDPVWVEEPGYFGAQAVFQDAAAKIVPVKVDAEGLSVSAGIASHPRARLVYTTPGHQFPLGVSMSVARRFELLQWAAKSGARILEDDYDSEFRYSSRPLPSLQGHDRNGSVIYIGSFSKTIFPALRLGYMVVPMDLLSRIQTAKFLTDWHSSTMDQCIVADFINEGHFMRHLRRMRTLYMERLDALLTSAHSELNGFLDIARPDAGMHAVATLPDGVDDGAVARALNRAGASTFPVSSCHLSFSRSSTLLLGFAAFSPPQIKQGCRLLAATLERVL
jgi:GntR family transcriptional regulator/MocR family aminotransferase